MIGPLRLHPVGVVTGALSAFREVALPAAVSFFVTGVGDSAAAVALKLLLFGVGSAVVAGVAGYVRWRTTLYGFDGRFVTLRRGVLSTSEVSVQVERIQSVDTVRGPVQRLFGVLELDIQTAGGGKDAEIALPALSREAAGELLAALDQAPRGDVREVAARLPGRRLGTGALLAGAATAGQLGYVAPVIAALTQVADELYPALAPRGEDGAQALLPSTFGEIAVIVAAVLLAAWLLSIIGSVVAFAGFTVVRDADRLRIRRGLFRRREAVVPIARVHAVRVVEGVLRQPFGLAALRVESAGYAAEPAAAKTLFPVLRRRAVDGFLAELLPELAGAVGPLERPPRRALRRYVLPSLSAAAAAAAALAIVLPPAWPASVTLVAAGAALGVLHYRAAGYALARDRVVVRRRRLARTTVLVDRTRLQQRTVSETPLQRRAALATFAFAVASRERFAVRHLERPAALDLLWRLRPRAGGPDAPR